MVCVTWFVCCVTRTVARRNLPIPPLPCPPLPFSSLQVEPSHALVTLLDPATWDAPELIVTAPATWTCNGQNIFYQVLERRWHDDGSFLVVAVQAKMYALLFARSCALLCLGFPGWRRE